MLDILDLIIQTVLSISTFSIDADLPDGGNIKIDNERVRQRVMMIRNLFTLQEDYATAIEKLKETVFICSQIPGFEPIVVEYGREIAKRYEIVGDSYSARLEPMILEKKGEIFSEQEGKLFDYFRANRGMLERLEEKARKSPAVGQKRQLWNSVLENLRGELDFSLYSGKK